MYGSSTFLQPSNFVFLITDTYNSSKLKGKSEIKANICNNSCKINECKFALCL